MFYLDIVPLGVRCGYLCHLISLFENPAQLCCETLQKLPQIVRVLDLRPANEASTTGAARRAELCRSATAHRTTPASHASGRARRRTPCSGLQCPFRGEQRASAATSLL